MKIEHLLNRIQNYNLMILSISDYTNGKLLVEKYYLKECEYKEFASCLSENKVATPFSCKFRHQSVKLSPFIDMLKLTFDNDESFDVVGSLNEQLKNTVFKIEFDDNGTVKAKTVKNSRIRKIINNYFIENRISPANSTLQLDQLVFSKKPEYTFRMYNVGQACISAVFADKCDIPSLVFDLGESRKCKSAISLLSNHLSKKNDDPTTIVISHFDNDHINMAKYIPTVGANLHFIMPDFLHPATDILKPNIQILLYAIITSGFKYYIFANNSLVTPFPYGNLTFLQGNCVKNDSNQSTNENSHSLITMLDLKEKQVLIPGDALYLDLFTKISSPLSPTYVILPHHSCEYRGAINRSIIDLSAVKEAFAFCGPHGKFKHPNKTHFKQYLNNNVSLHRLAKNKKTPIVYDDSNTITDSYFNILTTQFFDWII